MYDQAHRLRQMVAARQKETFETRILAITSGKGGVGKSNCTLNLGLGLCKAGKKVIVLDADIGFANIDVLMGLSPAKSLAHLFDCHTKIWEIMEHGPEGLQFIAGGSGFQDLLTLNESQIQYVVSQLQELQGYADYILIDTGAGLNPQTLRFLLSADEVFVITTPEPTSITDAYALIKLVSNRDRNVKIRLLVNRVSTPSEGEQTAEKIRLVAERFLQLRLESLGFVFEDPAISKAVKLQVPFISRFPDSRASRCMQQITARILESRGETNIKKRGMGNFLQRMLTLFRS